MSERDEAIRVARTILDVSRTDPDDDLNILARQFLRLSESSDPGLLAAEAIRRAVIYVMQLSDRQIETMIAPLFGEGVIRALAQDGFALIESRVVPASREAGLDAERLEQAMRATMHQPSDDGHDLDGHWDQWTVAIVAEYARLAAPSPSTGGSEG